MHHNVAFPERKYPGPHTLWGEGHPSPRPMHLHAFAISLFPPSPSYEYSCSPQCAMPSAAEKVGLMVLEPSNAPFSFTSSSFAFFSFFLLSLTYNYFLLLSIPSLSTGIVPLHFQRPNLGLVCCIYFVLSVFLS